GRGALQAQQRFYESRRERSGAGSRRPIRCSGESGFAVHEFPHVAVGNAGRGEEPLPRIPLQRFRLRRTARGAAAQANRRRADGQVLAVWLRGWAKSGKNSYTCFWINEPKSWSLLENGLAN